MNYRNLSATPLADLTRILIETAPALFAEFEALPRDSNGKVKLPQSLCQRIEAVLAAEGAARETARLREEDSRIHKEATTRLQMERDQKAGLDRLEQYAREQGLERSEKNAQLVQEWLDVYAKGYWSQSGVDAAIDVLRRKEVLQWQAPAPAAPPAPPAPASKPWKAGDPLPPDATEAQLRASSLAEVRAWSRRKQQR